MFDHEATALAIRVLQAAGVAHAAHEPLPVEQLAQAAGVSPESLELVAEQLEKMGLMLGGLGEGGCPLLLNAGGQYLTRSGNVPSEVLGFLPRVVDDLNARGALIDAGTVLVDEFRDRLLSGDGVAYAAALVPPAFAQAVDESLTLNLFAASIALTSHLSNARPANCVAEEIVAVRLIEEAECLLDQEAASGELSPSELRNACSELRGLFELFEDDDVLDLFKMKEPGDAAVAGEDPVKREMGVVDQRVEAWFQPFGWATRIGYLGS